MLKIDSMDKLVMERLENFILEGSAQRGWYTCAKTGRKMRSQEAIDQLALQSETAKEIAAELELKEADEAAEEEIATAIEAETEEAEDQQALEDWAEIKKDVEDLKNQPVPTDDMTHRLWAHVLVKDKGIKLVEINCEDCGEVRKIKTQDRFQVTRCVECQKKHRNRQRALRRKQKREESNKEQG